MQLIISPRLKHKMDRYVTYVSVMLFAKTSPVHLKSALPISGQVNQGPILIT